MRFILSAPLLLAFSFAIADEGLNNLRLSFNPLLNEYVKNLDIAATMTPAALKLGNPLSTSECQAIAKVIKESSGIDPFEFSYVNGSSISKMCGEDYGWQTNFILNQSGKTKFNLTYDIIIQLKLSDDDDKRLAYSNYYINKANQIVDIEYVSYDVKGNLDEFSVKTKDEKGNLYINHYVPKIAFPQKNITGTMSVQTWIPIDGSVSSFILRSRITDLKDTKKFYESLILSKTDKKDFESFHLPITHGWSGGFFVYENKYYSRPRFYSWLSIKQKDGKEACSFGSIATNGQWKSFPSDENEYYKCTNF